MGARRDESPRRTGLGPLHCAIKRGIDLVGSITGLAFTLLTGPFISLAILLVSPGPVLFKQIRVGLGGKPFTMYKFRTMYAGAEEQLDSILTLESVDNSIYKRKDDPRVTLVGRFLRRWSLDELPQFWNVLKGDMSLVGPRPEEARIAALYDEWHRRRFAVKPGMTGPMQVHGRANLTLDRRVQLEIEYIEQFSIRRDIMLLIQTIPAVLKGEGAH